MRGKYYKEKPEHAMRAHNIQTQLTLRDYKRLPEYHWSIDFKEANELDKSREKEMVWAEATAVTGEGHRPQPRFLSASRTPMEVCLSITIKWMSKKWHQKPGK